MTFTALLESGEESALQPFTGYCTSLKLQAWW
jgi:hypothetical protein